MTNTRYEVIIRHCEERIHKNECYTTDDVETYLNGFDINDRGTDYVFTSREEAEKQYKDITPQTILSKQNNFYTADFERVQLIKICDDEVTIIAEKYSSLTCNDWDNK